jgi:hypothetical protein
MKKLGLVLLSFTAISISQAPVIADSLPINLPMCYMITSRGLLLNLDYMCGGFKTTSTQTLIRQSFSTKSSKNRCERYYYFDLEDRRCYDIQNSFFYATGFPRYDDFILKSISQFTEQELSDYKTIAKFGRCQYNAIQTGSNVISLCGNYLTK